MACTMRTTGIGRIVRRALPAAVAALAAAPWALAQIGPPPVIAPAAEPATTVVADEPAPIDLNTLDGLLTALGSDNYQVRELASAALRQPGAPTEDQLVSLARREDISAEQRARLLNALRDRFENRPPGELAAVGIQMEEHVAGIRVARVFEDFPASGVLREGDVIMEIDGHDLSSARTGDKSRALMSIIVEQEPGGTAPMTIVREGERLTLDVPFGARADFQERNGTTTDVMERAWRIRAARLGLLDAESPAIAAEVRPADWLRSSRPLARLAGDTLLAGGSPIDEEVIAVTDINGRISAQNVKDPIQIRRNPQAQQAGALADGERQQSRLITMQTLGTELLRLRERMTDLRGELQEPGLTPDRRARLQEQLLICEQMDVELRARIEQLRGR